MVRTIDTRSLDSDPAYAALDKHAQAALNLIASPEAKKAFDLVPRILLRDRYGRTELGQRMFLSRRLIEAGVRFVTVSDNGRDTHADNFKQLKNRLMPPIDQAFPELLIDLKEPRDAGYDVGRLVDRFWPDAANQRGQRSRSLGHFRIRRDGGAGIPGGAKWERPTLKVAGRSKTNTFPKTRPP